MFCTSKEQETCDVEKRGCEGCFYEMTDEEKTLKCLYEHDVNIMDWYPVPATWISKITNISLYKTRKILRKLKEKGIVTFKRDYVPDRFSYEGELEEEGFFYCGWELTEKGRDNDTFRKIQKEEMELIDRIWGKDGG